MATPRINGKLYSFASVSIRVGQTLVTAVKSINYSDNREQVFGYGAARAFGPLARTQGKYTADNTTAEIEKGQLADLRKALADSNGGKSFGTVEFEIVVSYEEPGRGLITDTIQRCTWAKNAAKADDGGDPLYDAVEFSTMQILWNGLSLFDQSDA